MMQRNGGPNSKSPGSLRPPQSTRTSWIPKDDGIPALQAELSRFHAAQPLRKRHFEEMRSGISGLTEVTIGRVNVRAVIANGKKPGQGPNAFLISDFSEASLCEIIAFNGLDLRRDCIQILDETGKMKYIFAVPPLVLRALKDMASATSESEKPVNSLIPPIQGMSDPALDIVTSRLGMTAVLYSSNGMAEDGLRMLASQITVVLTMRDPENKQYYYLVLGQEAESAFRLYMSSFPEGISTENKGHYMEVHRLQYKDREMLLCQEM